MGLSRWHKFGYWLERFGVLDPLLLKNTGERTLTGRAFTNRINGHLVVR